MKLAKTNDSIYRFSEGHHLHEICVGGVWKALTGCTTVLSVIAKPALIQWAANQAVEYIKANALKGNLGYNISEEKLEEARNAHRVKKEKAGEQGTDVHSEVESLLKRIIEANGGIVGPDEVSDKPQITHFLNWARDNKVKFLESEKHIYSRHLFVGGIVDIVCEIDGQTWLVDIKTGSGIYPEHFWQMAGYQFMLQEMELHPNITGYIVLNLKKDGSFEEKRSISNLINQNAFMACLEIYRIQEKIKNQIIK